METSDIIKIVNDLINTNSIKFENVLFRIEKIVEKNNYYEWYQEGWVIALISALSTALLIALTELFIYFYKRKKIKEGIAYDLCTEIFINVLTVKKTRESNKVLIEDFKQKAIANDFSDGHPSLRGVKHRTDDCYRAHLSNLSLLLKNKSDLLGAGIKVFYNLVSDYDENSRIIGESFEKYYAENPMISYSDIVNIGNGQYKDSRLIILNGYDIATQLQLRFNIDAKIKLKKENIKSIYELQNSTIDDVQQEADNLGIDVRNFIFIIKKYKLYKNTVNTGKYIKTKDTIFKKIRMFLVSRA
ncbi:MAG: hypothetical protein WAW11_00185 [Patescibacteria group bacterium]